MTSADTRIDDLERRVSTLEQAHSGIDMRAEGERIMRSLCEGINAGSAARAARSPTGLARIRSYLVRVFRCARSVRCS